MPSSSLWLCDGNTTAGRRPRYWPSTGSTARDITTVKYAVMRRVDVYDASRTWPMTNAVDNFTTDHHFTRIFSLHAHDNGTQ